MAPAKQFLILIFISAHIIFATCKDANPSTSRPLANGLTKPNDENVEPKDKDDDKKKNKKKKTNEKEDGDVATVLAKKMRKIEKKIIEFNASLKERMDNHECVSECDEVLAAAIDDIKKALDSLDNQNLVKANFDVSAVSTNVDTCNDCFDEMVGGDPKVKKLSDWVQKMTGDVLEALEKAKSIKPKKEESM